MIKKILISGFLISLFFSFSKSVYAKPDDNSHIFYARLIMSTDIFYGVTYGNNEFIVIGYNGIILTSTNGKTWIPQKSGTTNNLYGITYGNSYFVAVGWNGTILTSYDGRTWTSQKSGTNSPLQGITFGDKKFVAVGWNGVEGAILTSLDGINWTPQKSGIILPKISLPKSFSQPMEF